MWALDRFSLTLWALEWAWLCQSLKSLYAKLQLSSSYSFRDFSAHRNRQTEMASGSDQKLISLWTAPGECAKPTTIYSRKMEKLQQWSDHNENTPIEKYCDFLQFSVLSL